MRIATWNLNNRVGLNTFRPEAAAATNALNADLVVLTEYFPRQHAESFEADLRAAKFDHSRVAIDTGEKANRILIASKHELRPLDIELPAFDKQFPANVLSVVLPVIDLSIIGVRIPWYVRSDVPLVLEAWDWLLTAAARLADRPALILGDLNAGITSGRARGGEHFRRILQSGWHRATPATGSSFYGSTGNVSEIDHILGTAQCSFGAVRYVTEIGQYEFAGSKTAISDHAVLIAEVTV
jgi:hypothetical protein